MIESAGAMAPENRVIIALGGNIGDPAANIHEALRRISLFPEIQGEIAVSRLYLNPPVGYEDQPDFVNAVAAFETGACLPGKTLLKMLNSIEEDMGRERSFRNAPRPLDLDIIDHKGDVSRDPVLTLPHPRAKERAFVLLPLMDILPDYVFPDGGALKDLLAALPAADIDGMRPL